MQAIYMGTNAWCQKPKCLDKPKNYTASRKKTGGNVGLESGKTMAKYVKAPGAEDDIHR
jgi:hypothetical protein